MKKRASEAVAATPSTSQTTPGSGRHCQTIAMRIRLVTKTKRLRSVVAGMKRISHHEAVLDEILEERVDSNRGPRNPRDVKRKMSGFPLRSSLEP